MKFRAAFLLPWSILVFSHSSYSDSTAVYSTFIENVSVPQSEISLDSTVAGRYYYSGAAYYDLDTRSGTVSVHVYMEEIPFAPYVIVGTRYYGRGSFVRIDSLCTGDVGAVQGKAHCSARWSYSTRNSENHCRLKIGLGNFLYAKNKDSLDGQINLIYRYSRIGAIESIQIDSSGSGSTGLSLVRPKYTLGGQPLIDDVATPIPGERLRR